MTEDDSFVQENLEATYTKKQTFLHTTTQAQMLKVRKINLK